MALTVAASCGNGAGDLCEGDADCPPDLQCLERVAVKTVSQCISAGPGFCSLPCTSDAECKALGDDFVCPSGCPSAVACVPRSSLDR